MTEHIPVLLEETIDLLNIRQGTFAIDGTVNGGGHAEAILDKIGPEGKLLGIDLDPEMLAISRKKLGDRKNVMLIEGNYADMADIMRDRELPKADTILLDLGFSSGQIDPDSGRGFSFKEEASGDVLSMTYSPDSRPAYEVLREMSEEDIADMIYTLGGERMSRRIAKAIYDRERKDPIVTSGELRQVVAEVLPKNYERGRIDPATRTFQALRIFINRELENLEAFMKSIEEVVAPGGRVAIISFHSLEDRIVKRSFKKMQSQNIATLLTKKPITASESEIKDNPRSRSAKLRGIQIIT